MTTGGASLLVDRWDARLVARLLVETGMEQVIMVPTVVRELLATVREHAIQLPRLRHVVVGGDRTRPELTTAAEEVGIALLAQWG